jgi:beta-aspartyl-peptidase (threonine type)
MRWAFALHGGAGEWAEDSVPLALDALRRTAQQVRTLLEQGASALDAVCEAVVLLEDAPIFNAGTGSVLNRDGEVEMDASVMLGSDLRFGAVAAITRVRNPALVARCVMEKSPHAILAGEGAVRFARAQGFADYDPITETARAEYKRRALRAGPGTVGATALDAAGTLAAATSTGGTILKWPGRVGDTPLPGAGTYAGGMAAVSATGKGELILRALAAKRVYDLIDLGRSPNAAIAQTLSEMRRSVGSNAGFIAVTRSGEVGVGHDTSAMLYAICSELRPEIHVERKVG